MTLPEYDEKCNCDLCTSQRAPKPISVRSQRSFQEHMQTLHQGIDNLVYAAEQACGIPIDGSVCFNKSISKCEFRNDTCCQSVKVCRLHSLRRIIGDHTPQSDIEIPDNNIQAKRKEER